MSRATVLFSLTSDVLQAVRNVKYKPGMLQEKFNQNLDYALPNLKWQKKDGEAAAVENYNSANIDLGEFLTTLVWAPHVVDGV